MADSKRISLSAPFQWHGREISEVEIREPTGWECQTLGEPRILVYNSISGGYYVENPGVIAKYLDKCVQHQSGADIVKLLGMRDVLKLKAVLFDFFTEAEAANAQEKLASFASALNGSPSSKSAN